MAGFQVTLRGRIWVTAEAYFFRPTPEHAERDARMYGATHAFLPARNGVRPNTLHVIFDFATVAILILLAVLTAQPR